MRKARTVLVTSLFVATCVVSLTAPAQAQTREKFVISVRAGGVNAVTGRAAVRAHGNSEWQTLTIKEDLEAGDVVKTGTDGRVEMLLNPGSYLRIGENSEFELSDNSLENLEVRLIRGTAVVEATGADNMALQINITTPHTRLAIVQRGLYRLNVVPGDNTELIVRKGRVMLDRSHTKIKGGNKVVFNSDTFFIAKLDNAEKKKTDDFDLWSKERAETVAQANRKMKGREMSLVRASFRDSWSRAFSADNNIGLWWFNPRYGCYTFVPFFMGWGSPYGSSYSNAFYPGYYCCSPTWYGSRPQSYPAVSNVPSGNAAPSSPGSGARPNPVFLPPASPERGSRPPAMERRIDRHQNRLPNT
jgi:hypothetical protein